jgi:hypothetical protein
MFGQNTEYGVNSHMMICSDKARLLGPVYSVFEAGNFNVMRLIFEVALRLPMDFLNLKCIRFVRSVLSGLSVEYCFGHPCTTTLYYAAWVSFSTGPLRQVILLWFVSWQLIAKGYSKILYFVHRPS